MPQNIVIVLDITSDSSDSDLNDKSFFGRGKECTTRIIERKIMSLEEVSIGIILLGSNKNSDLEILYELEKPSWTMIKKLPDMASHNKGDLCAALNASYSLFKKKSSKVKMFENRIILISSLTESMTNIDMSVLEEILNMLKNNNIRIDVVGCKTDLASKIVGITNGLSTTFDNAIKEFIFYRKKHVNGRPWDVDLTLGSNTIPVLIYKRNIDEPILKRWKNVKDSTDNKNRKDRRKDVQKKTLYFNSENEDINSKELINSYSYGNKIIPILPLDKSLIYQSGPKSLIIYGFTPSSNINWENLNDNSLSYVVGDEGNRNTQITIKYIAHCLHELNLVGIAKGVKEKDNTPRMYALMPVFDTNDFACLSMASVCYKEEIKYMTFPQITKKQNCTTDQIEAFKDLIAAMDLTDIPDGTGSADNEAFVTGQTPSPSAQHSVQCVVFRAKNPGVHLDKPSDDVLSLLEVPPSLQNRAKDSLERLQSLFVLNNVKTEKEKQNTADNNYEPMEYSTCSNMQEDIEKKISSIGTINPINDYKMSLKLGKTLNDLAQEMIDAIESLIYSNLDEHFTKALDALSFFRLECVNGNPSYYNNWLNNFKFELAHCGRNDVIEFISKNEMDLILKNENVLSEMDIKGNPIQQMETDTNFTELKVSSELEDLFK